jgi:hypothetical protein
VVWRYAWGGHSWKKHPFSARIGRPADVTNPAAWAPFDVALRRLRREPDTFDGIGFAFAEGAPFVIEYWAQRASEQSWNTGRKTAGAPGRAAGRGNCCMVIVGPCIDRYKTSTKELLNAKHAAQTREP